MYALLTLAFAAKTDVCSAWDLEGERITVEESSVVESSGIAVGRRDEAVWYTVEDAGSEPYIQIVSSSGTYVGQQYLIGASNVDWEDLASGPCPPSVAADSCLYIADIGDNDETREDIVIWAVAESTAASEVAVACRFAYEDGAAHDAEALFIDPEGGLRIVTKSSNGTPSVFGNEAPRCDSETEVLLELATLNLSGETAEDREVTGAAMSADGQLLVLRSSTQVWMWRGCTLNWAEVPEVHSLASEPQGEAIAVFNDGSLLTSSEGTPLRLQVLPCTQTDAVSCPSCGCAQADGLAVLLILLPIPLIRRSRPKSPPRSAPTPPV